MANHVSACRDDATQHEQRDTFDQHPLETAKLHCKMLLRLHAKFALSATSILRLWWQAGLDESDADLFHNPHLLEQPVRWIRPLISWGLGGGFFEALWNSIPDAPVDGRSRHPMAFGQRPQAMA